MKDWLGNEYGVGDKVVYAAMSGRSVTMILAEVVDIYEAPKYSWREEDSEKITKVKVQPLRSSRWEQHSGHQYYVDERTGKRIDPWRGEKHIDAHGHYRHRVTGDTAAELPYKPGTAYEDWVYVPTEFKHYVKSVTDAPKPVTLTITQNVTKWNGNIGDIATVGITSGNAVEGTVNDAESDS